MDAPLSVKLKVKYGLTDDPSERRIIAWRRSTTEYLDKGLDLEESGRRAALDAFGELDQVLYFSEADTIEHLLREVAAMRELGVALRIKYRTETVPTDDKIAEWASLVEELVKGGIPKEEAGRIAAGQVFDVNSNLILKAEADTIEALLVRIREKSASDDDE